MKKLNPTQQKEAIQEQNDLPKLTRKNT